MEVYVLFIVKPDVGFVLNNFFIFDTYEKAVEASRLYDSKYEIEIRAKKMNDFWLPFEY